MILPYDYIRGLVDGEGTFTFSTSSTKLRDGTIKKIRVPSFAIKMHERDQELLESVRDTLHLKNKVYNYYSPSTRKANHGRQAMLIVREFPQLKNIVIPFFYGKLYGNKGKQFNSWLEKMGDEDVGEKTKFIYKLFKSGYFDKNPRF